MAAVLTAGCGNNAAEMTDRGNKKNQSDAEVTSAPEKAGNRKPELKDIGGEEIISTRQEIPAEPAAKERNEDKLLPDKEEKPAEEAPGDEENAGTGRRQLKMCRIRTGKKPETVPARRETGRIQ